jgi:hypothetical protein
MKVNIVTCLGAMALAISVLSRVPASAAIVINEFAYDDTGAADDREFVEIYNNGAAPVDVSGWVVTGRDATTVNLAATIPAATTIPAGGFYVVGNTGVPNVNQVVAGGFLENDIESVEVRDAAGALQDALAYETNKGIAGNLTGSDLPAQIGPGIFGNSQNIDLAGGPPLLSTVSQARYVDGRDTNNNGRDFGMRPSTPGATNTPAGLMALYLPPDPTGQTVGSDVPGLTGSFVNARYIDPTVADANNPNAIAPSPTTGNRAIVAWDPSGGGNGITSNQTFGAALGGFAIEAYLDTSDQPQNSNATGVLFTGAEVTIYGVGGGDALTNLTDLGGNIGLGAATLPASESANGTTGVAWVYERTAISGATAATQMLYLVDANDGGDSDVGGNTPLDWTILQAIDISGLSPGWFDMSINVDPLGNGVATFNGAVYAFTTAASLSSGAFNVGYRENLQIASDGTPDALLRPATFTMSAIPEPATLALIGLSAVGLIATARRRRQLA